MRARIKLRHKKDQQLHREQELAEEVITIGRLEGSIVHLADPRRVISKTHARIEREADQYQITDLSVNHTYLNEKMMTPGTPYALTDGDKIRIGEYLLEFWTVPEAQAEPLPAEPPPIELPLPEYPLPTDKAAAPAPPAPETPLPLPEPTMPRSAAGTSLPDLPEGLEGDARLVARMSAVIDILLESHSRLMRSHDKFRMEYLGRTFLQTPSMTRELLLDTAASDQEASKRLGMLKRATSDIALHLVGLLDGYARSIDEGSRRFLQQTDPDQIRQKLGEMRFRLGPLEIPYRFVPGFYQWKLMQTYRRRHRELQEEERGVLETRYFRPSFIKAYEARLAGGKVDAPPDQEPRRKH